ncbi:MAG: hypothetical protein ACRAVC_20960 [Trichormus sp.]
MRRTDALLSCIGDSGSGGRGEGGRGQGAGGGGDRGDKVDKVDKVDKGDRGDKLALSAVVGAASPREGEKYLPPCPMPHAPCPMPNTPMMKLVAKINYLNLLWKKFL